MPPQLWGGLECTVNRVHDRYRDQIRATGHHDRPDDLDLLSDTGICALRYPILWERISPDDPARCDWDWTDQRLGRLRQLGIGVIAGLVHHGSGPAYTSLVDSGFAPGLARHAAAAAHRYPWVMDWTPVNEPLTTARFSALYGHWHPHQRSERTFWLALLNQIDATRLSMQAIRRVNPAARLIQTDDLGRTYATAALRDQAAFDNLRRWASWDLLCGRIGQDHPLWDRLSAFGFQDRLRAIADDPCPPAIIGINHYLTSDRFLDHRLQRYPPHSHGGSESQLYADVEALRVLEPPPQGLEGALREAWARYRIPLAITEVHNGCTREEQMRWAAQAWDMAERLCADDIPVEAVTLWSLLGSSGWNTLLTGEGAYEPGLWDVSGGAPRATALLPLAQALSRPQDRPLLAGGAGWWQRPVRIGHPPVTRPAPMKAHLAVSQPRFSAPPLLICGATGTLGQAMARACALRNIPFLLTSRRDLDLSAPSRMAERIEHIAPWAVVNAAGWVRVDEAEAAPDPCMTVNAQGAIALARVCQDRGIPTLSFSSDLVFDGQKDRPYVEDDPTGPLNRYGLSKAEMERGIGALAGRHLIVRTAAFFSPHDEFNFAADVVRSLAQGGHFVAADDLVVTPTYVPHLVATALDLLIDGEVGLWHLTSGTPLSWSDFARRIAARCGHDPARIRAVPHRSLCWAAERPAYAALATRRGAALPPLAAALDQFTLHLPPHWARQAA
ncbi:SDR family oxidoreductase [Sphingobium chlorophenolicum]|uniref:dTDP-4-dehydrorhamnose reductase n=1 Tax=Sphingobium chlorophenolicum TaxID=46429 RepID=A0A081RB55_SPHCR|nr:NAD(P)-dependent oxidoreductase [Sphingobium chlorophenolicum]KEQ52428.1 dTDP-4-dehydrorhamnose reductase [Sphingobium chlorophenolicum]